MSEQSEEQGTDLADLIMKPILPNPVPEQIRQRSMSARIDELVSENIRLKEDIKDLRLEKQRLLDSTSQLHAEILALHRMQDEILAECRTLSKEHAESARQLLAIQTSTSWRLTGPLRGLVSKLKSRFG